MRPQHHRLGRVLIALGVGALVLVVALVASAQSPAPEEYLPLAPLVGDPQTSEVAAEADPAVTAVPTPTRVSSDESQFERVLHPMLLEAKRHRAAAAAADPTYWTRLDPRLNSTRLNFLLFGYGETHEPPLTERAFIGSLR